jgi:hypothetical protein
MKATDKINLLLKGISMKDIQKLEADEKKELEAEEKKKDEEKKPEEKKPEEKPEEKPDQISELLKKIDTMSETLKALQSENASNVDTEGEEEAEKTSMQKAEEVMNNLFGNGKEGN